MLTKDLKEFIKGNLDEIENSRWDAIIKYLPYNYALSLNEYDSYNSLFQIFKESKIPISDNDIIDTFDKLGYKEDSCTIIPLYNQVKGEKVEESLKIIEDHLRKTIKDYIINSGKYKTSLYVIFDQLEDILGNNIDVFKSPNYNYIRHNVIEEPIKIRVGLELQAEGEYIELRIDLDDNSIYKYDDDLGHFIPGFGFAYNTKLLELYVGKIITYLG